MNKKNLSDYKRKYAMFRHHAWAGLGLLSVLLAINYFFPIDDIILLLFVFVLVVYILVSLMFTYKFRAGLSVQDEVIQHRPSVEVESAKVEAGMEKERCPTAGLKAFPMIGEQP